MVAAAEKYAVKITWSIVKPSGAEGNEGYTIYKDMDYEDVIGLETAFFDTLKGLGLAKLAEKTGGKK